MNVLAWLMHVITETLACGRYSGPLSAIGETVEPPKSETVIEWVYWLQLLKWQWRKTCEISKHSRATQTDYLVTYSAASKVRSRTLLICYTPSALTGLTLCNLTKKIFLVVFLCSFRVYTFPKTAEAYNVYVYFDTLSSIFISELLKTLSEPRTTSCWIVHFAAIVCDEIIWLSEWTEKWMHELIHWSCLYDFCERNLYKDRITIWRCRTVKCRYRERRAKYEITSFSMVFKIFCVDSNIVSEIRLIYFANNPHCSAYSLFVSDKHAPLFVIPHTGGLLKWTIIKQCLYALVIRPDNAN